MFYDFTSKFMTLPEALAARLEFEIDVKRARVGAVEDALEDVSIGEAFGEIHSPGALLGRGRGRWAPILFACGEQMADGETLFSLN